MLWVRAAARKSSEVASAIAFAAAGFQSLVSSAGRFGGREEKRVMRGGGGGGAVFVLMFMVVELGLTLEGEVCKQVFERCTRGSKPNGDVEGGA